MLRGVALYVTERKNQAGRLKLEFRMVLRLRNVGEIRGYTGLKVECFEEIKGRNREGTCKCRIWSMLKI